MKCLYKEATAVAVKQRLLTSQTWVQSQTILCGFHVGRNGIEAGFS
jgi:hypothetical protein